MNDFWIFLFLENGRYSLKQCLDSSIIEKFDNLKHNNIQDLMQVFHKNMKLRSRKINYTWEMLTFRLDFRVRKRTVRFSFLIVFLSLYLSFLSCEEWSCCCSWYKCNHCHTKCTQPHIVCLKLNSRGRIVVSCQIHKTHLSSINVWDHHFLYVHCFVNQ